MGLRKTFISKPLLKLINNLGLLPSISQTEKIALRSGDIWIDGNFFKGSLDFGSILNEPFPSLTDEEQKFIDTKVDKVCKDCNDYEIFAQRDLSKKTWKYLKDNKFFGMIIPKEYGGLGFTALGHSAVIQKLSTHSQVLAITTMVPNSLGPAELLLHYGTQKQKDYFLPRLAKGEEIPCFALTEPLAGSDATSIRSEGIVFKDDNDEIKIRLTFEKRYITLGSIATLIGLAFNLRDPDNLLGDEVELGITCALVDSKLEGVIQGKRHDPLNVPFINSPLKGEDVVIGISDIIGAESGIGEGWKMLMESLSVGRGISLPSVSCGATKLCSHLASSYSSIREQFGVSISAFEGVQDVLARLATNAYILDNSRLFTLGAIDSGKKPTVINAVMKYHSTEIFRRSVNDAMDVIGGAGISLGKKNLIGHAYIGAPIAITVEGANIMTRTLIQFGQGVIRCHPYAYKEIEAIENNDLDAFDKNFFAHIGFVIKNFFKMLFYSLSRGYLYRTKSKGVSVSYERRLAWSAATFAFLTDAVVGLFGGELKKKEMLSARFADILSNMYLLTASLRAYKAHGEPKDEEVYIRYIGDDLLFKIQNSYDDIFKNIFSSKISKFLLFPLRVYSKLNYLSSGVRDTDAQEITKSVVTQSQMKTKLSEGIFHSDVLNNIDSTFSAHLDAAPIARKIKKAIRAKELPKKPIYQLVNEALKLNIINEAEHLFINSAISLKDNAVQVDSFDVQDYLKRVSK